MRILSLLWGFSLGGIGKCALTYHCLSDFDDISLLTVCISGENWGSDLNPLNEISAEIIPIKSRLDFSWIKKSIAIIENFAPDLLFVHGFNGPVIAKILQFFLKRKLPFVCSYHGSYHPPSLTRVPLAPVFNRSAEYIYHKHAVGVVSVCEFSKRYLVSKGVPADKVTVVYNGLSKERSARMKLDRAAFGLHDEDVVIGVASRLDPVKGLSYLVAAFTEVVDSCPEARLVIVGDGTCTDDLRKQCNDLGLGSRVYFAGYQDNVEAWLDLFDIFALPSLAECHSIALLEGMRAGKAIVATDVGGNTESVRDEKEALIVPPKDSRAIAHELVVLLKNPSLRETLGLNAKKRFAENFTEEIMLANLAAWLRNCAASVGK